MDTIEKLVDDLLSSPLTDQGNIIVDDFSTDGTREILINKIGDLVDQIIFHDNNQGKEAALRSGFAHTTGDVVIVQDEDLEYNPQEYPVLLQLIVDGKAYAVCGSRFLRWAITQGTLFLAL